MLIIIKEKFNQTKYNDEVVIEVLSLHLFRLDEQISNGKLSKDIKKNTVKFNGML